MTRTLFSRVVPRLWLGAAMVVAVSATSFVLAQAPAGSGRHDLIPGRMPTTAGMMSGQKIMMSKMAATDQKLTELLATMNAAQGDEKIAAIAAVVTELAEQRKQMQQMMAMQFGMMEQMTARMSAMHGNANQTEEKAAPAQPADRTQEDHSDHHSPN